MSFTSLFAGKAHSNIYKSYRPVLSKVVANPLSAVVKKWTNTQPLGIAVDVGCGSGQATEFLQDLFDIVIGIDPSGPQIAEAKESGIGRNKIEFVVGSDVGIPLQNGSCSYVQAFQAAHWFDLPQFYREVDRILQPGGILVLGAYARPHVLLKHNEDIDKGVLEAFNNEYLNFYQFLIDGGYFKAEIMKQIDSLYSNWRLPYSDQFCINGLEMKERWTVGRFVSFLKTWSGWQSYVLKTGDVSKLSDLENRWNGMLGNSTTLQISWPLVLLCSRKPNL